MVLNLEPLAHMLTNKEIARRNADLGTLGKQPLSDKEKEELYQDCLFVLKNYNLFSMPAQIVLATNQLEPARYFIVKYPVDTTVLFNHDQLEPGDDVELTTTIIWEGSGLPLHSTPNIKFNPKKETVVAKSDYMPYWRNFK